MERGPLGRPRRSTGVGTRFIASHAGWGRAGFHRAKPCATSPTQTTKCCVPSIAYQGHSHQKLNDLLTPIQQSSLHRLPSHHTDRNPNFLLMILRVQYWLTRHKLAPKQVSKANNQPQKTEAHSDERVNLRRTTAHDGVVDNPH